MAQARGAYKVAQGWGWGGPNSATLNRRVKQFSKNRISFMEQTDVILTHAFPEGPKHTLM